MSIAISDETTSQSVFQDAVGVIRDNYSVAAPPTGPLTNTEYNLIPDGDLDKSGNAADGLKNRKFDTTGVFSWSALIRQIGTTGPSGNLCQVIVVVSRQPSGSPDFVGSSTIPELCSVNCTASDDDARTITIKTSDFDLVPNSGYIIDGETGITYSIISRNDGVSKTVTLLTEGPSNADIAGDRDFWVVPGPQDGSSGGYGLSSPAVRVFQTMVYLP
jgi:hypothetical protein